MPYKHSKVSKLMNIEEQNKISRLDKPFRAALEACDNLTSRLQDLKQSIDDADEDEHSGISTYVYQLVLQLRLEHEHVLRSLLNSNKALCAALGIELNQTLHKQIDAAIYQLGFSNFYGEFSILSHLVDKLRKALSKTQKLTHNQAVILDNTLEKTAYRAAKKAQPNKLNNSLQLDNPAISDKLHILIGLQGYFALCIEQLTEAYHAMPGLPKFGITYDYLAGIKGPMAQLPNKFQQVLSLSQEIAQKCAHSLKLSHQENFNLLLHIMNQSVEKLVHTQTQLQLAHNEQLKKIQAKSASPTVHPSPKPAPSPPPAQAPTPQPTWRQTTLNIFNRK